MTVDEPPRVGLVDAPAGLRALEGRDPWTRLRDRHVYANGFIDVVEHDVLRPDGQPGLYGVVHARLATGVVAMTDDDHVVLVGQHRFPFDAWSWELPEGGADPGEDGLTAIRRELREETGYEAASWDRLGGQLHLTNSHSSEVGELYLATGLQRVAEPHLDGEEELVVALVAFDAALALVDDGTVTDAMTVMGLLLAARARTT